MKRIHNILACIFTLCLLGGCRDDRFYELWQGDGVTDVAVTLTSQPFGGTSLDTRATAGDAIKEVDNITVLAYKSVDEGGNKKLVKIWRQEDLRDLDTKTNTAMPDGWNDPANHPGANVAGNLDQAETSTTKTTFRLPDLPYGTYYIYAVANVDTKPWTEETVETPEKLKEMSFPWNGDKIASNNQMFGYFTLDDADSRQQGFFEAQPVTITKSSQKLHCWMKRLASKVTLVFDPSGLHESIHIYINKVTIKDIPAACALGQENTPASKKDLISEGESISFNYNNEVVKARPDYDNNHSEWLSLSKGSGLKGAVEGDENNQILHSETFPALYFYENMQGNYSSDPQKDRYDKTPNEEEAGKNVYEPDEGEDNDWKDRVKFGTYIEVDAYYVSENKNNMSKGPIKYRFMLGKDTEFDYNAERNMHYKLTLAFRGYANQPDWHIEYKENEPDAYLPELFYVPYLYNKRSMLPIRLVGECLSVKAQIVENNWAPYDEKTGTVPPGVVAAADLLNKKLGFRWNEEVYWNSGKEQSEEDIYGLHPASFYKNKYGIYAGEKESYKNEGEIDEYLAVYDGQDRKITPIWAGFLSLTVPKVFENDKIENLPTEIFNNSSTCWYSNIYKKDDVWHYDKQIGSKAIKWLREYFLGTYEGGDEYTAANSDTPQHVRLFELAKDIPGGTKDRTGVLLDNTPNNLNGYVVTGNGDGSSTLEIPMWTRPKDMIHISGFSGNNPYQTYMRKAVVRFTFIFKGKNDGETVKRVKYLPVFQVRRVVNPKGVWRSSSNCSSFHVDLKHLDNAKSDHFSSIISRGEWEAEIMDGGSSQIYLGKRGESSSSGGKITGATGSKIEFDIKFRGPLIQGGTACAIVNVKYHGGSAIHTILVRQGYDTPLAVHTGGTQWSSYSIYKFDDNADSKNEVTVVGELTINPLALGSMFKLGNYAQGLRIRNNKEWGPLVSINDQSLYLTNGGETNGVPNKTLKWSEIEGHVYGKDGPTSNAYPIYEWADIEINDRNRTYGVPTYDDFMELRQHDFGYGVCYADGATETKDNVDDAFSFFNDENHVTSSVNGMRGVFVFNLSNGNNIFFPIGAFGMGRRVSGQSVISDQRGYLRYGASATVLDSKNGLYNKHRPICYDNPHNPGCLYWLKKPEGNWVAWDMNYMDMTFAPYDHACSQYYNGDAIPIKPVLKKN